MQQGNMLIDRCCRLRTAVAIHAFEIKDGHPVLAEGAFEGGAAVPRFGCVISHIFNGSPFYLSGHWAIGALPWGRTQRSLATSCVLVLCLAGLLLSVGEER
jgi:hypothetical protein